MRTAIDANVFSAILSWEPTAERAIAQLGLAKTEGALVISPFVFSELLAYPGATESYVRRFLEDTAPHSRRFSDWRSCAGAGGPLAYS